MRKYQKNVVINTTLVNENNRIQIDQKPNLTVVPLEVAEGQVLPMVVPRSC